MTIGNNELARLRAAIEDLLDLQVRPLVKIHGGGVVLIDVTAEGEVYLEFEGACNGCSLKSITYALGVRQKLLPLDGVTAVHMKGVRLSKAALERVEKYYGGHTSWVGAQPTVSQ